MQKHNSQIVWSHPSDDLDLHSHQVDIWRVFLDHRVESAKLFESSLSVDESQRAARFHFAADKDRFIIAHGCLRNILARYLYCEPGQLSFFVGEYGKPELVDKKIDFNLSHSGEYALIAIAQQRKVGIDVECVRQDIEYENIANRYFSPKEVSELILFPPEQRATAFFNCWTRKEAYIKAHGLGLSLPLDSFDVSLNEPAILRTTRPDPSEAARWTLLSLEVDSDYAGALAVEVAVLSGEAASKGKELEFKYWDWNFVS